MGFPVEHGSNVTPSGLLLSLVVRPWGSFVEETWACLIAVQTMSLTCECLCCLAELRRQQSPWSPLASTCLLHGQVWGSQVLIASLKLCGSFRHRVVDPRPSSVTPGASHLHEVTKQLTSVLGLFVTLRWRAVAVNGIVPCFLYYVSQNPLVQDSRRELLKIARKLRLLHQECLWMVEEGWPVGEEVSMRLMLKRLQMPAFEHSLFQGRQNELGG